MTRIERLLAPTQPLLGRDVAAGSVVDKGVHAEGFWEGHMLLALDRRAIIGHLQAVDVDTQTLGQLYITVK
jgi:hypothetical protein